MDIATKIVGYLLIALFSSASLGLVGEGNSDYDSYDAREVEAIRFADSVFECGVYYQYTAGGMKKSPHVSRDLIQTVSQNSKSLLATAGLLYKSVGISAEAKYREFMQRAKIMLKERQHSQTGVSDLIYEFGEKCRRLLVGYPEKLRGFQNSQGISE